MTRDIFVNDTRVQAVLPLETANNSLQIKAANQQKQQRKKNDIEAFKTRPGFKNYLEQEEMDKASINDLLSMSNREVTKQINKHVPLSQSMMPHVNYEDNPPSTGIK